MLVLPVSDCLRVRSMCLSILESLGQRLYLLLVLFNRFFLLSDVLIGVLQCPTRIYNVSMIEITVNMKQ